MDVLMTSTVTRSDQVLSTDLGGEIVMMDLESGEYFNMKDTAHRIWELVETPKTVGDLVEALQAEFSVDPDTCQKDVTSFVAELQSAGIVTLS